MRKNIILVLGILLVILAVGIGIFILLTQIYKSDEDRPIPIVEEIFNDDNEESEVDNVENTPDETSSDENGDIQGYKYEYEVEVWEYPQDTSLVGFKTCSDSSCVVYGLPASEFAKLTLGERFTLRFNSMELTGAAAGTSYAKVIGDYELIPR